jgi:DnaJ-domain-containing protein 1
VYEAFVVLLGGMVAAALFLMALAKMAQGWRDRADTSHAERTRPASATANRRESERDRIRKKYFEKERRQRQARQREARFRQQHAPPRDEPGPSSERARPEPTARTESEHLVVLGLKPGFSQDDLRRAYRARVAEYHPDRVASLGPKLKRLAEEETKRITAAYAFLKRDER